ncbi:MAG: 50S ribosomal protein L18e [Candidatus Pacearchaeota archaeon]|nr:50S ribosomal protein L18e [Candidatus Pacearchaeota archaeon]
MKSKTKINEQAKKKLNPEVVETIFQAKKNKKWLEVADILTRPRRIKTILNLDQIDKESKEGDTIVVPGKVLGEGNVTKKIRIVALQFSEEARKKLKDKKCEVVSLKEEIAKNKEAKGINVLK